MPKEIIYNPDASRRMLMGINHVAKAAAVTFGSSGPAVVIQHRTNGILPVVTRDGATVANSIFLEDRIADLGGRMLRDVAGAVSREVGDGTTTAIVLAQALAAECLKSVTAGFDPLQLKRGLETALCLVERELKRKAKQEVSSEWIENIANVAAKDEPMVGHLLAEAMAGLGDTGLLTFQLGNSREDQLEIIEGLHYGQGYLSPYFITDKSRAEAVLENPYILLYDRKIEDLMDLIPILEAVKEQNRSLLIIAENVVDRALTGLLLNHVRGVFAAVAVKPPGFGDKRIDRLKDLAVLTGGQAILEGNFKRLEDVTLAELGQAKRIVVGELSTTIIGAAGDKKTVAALSERLAADAEIIRARKPGEGSPTGNRHELDELEERSAALAGKTGVYHVGGTTDMEIKERMVRIENAYKSALAAVEEGVIAGCGVGLYRCSPMLDQAIMDEAGQQQGLRIMKQALAAPLTQLLRNAGINPEIVCATINSRSDPDMSFDTQHQVYGNFLELGIMDPVKVTRLALRSAVSVVSTLMLADTVVMDMPDKSIMSGFSPEWAASTREDPRA